MALIQPTSIFSLSLMVVLAQAAPLTTPTWLQPMMPVKGTTLKDEIKCYSLPYGGIGFLSHFLTYWAVFWLGYGRRPYMPWKKLSAGVFDFFLSILQIVVSIAIASFTINRCRNRWQFMLIAIWKIVMSIEVGIWGLRASWLAMRGRSSIHKNGGIMWSFKDWTPYTLIVYSMGMVVGMTGLLSLVWRLRDDKQIVQISIAFGSVTGFVVATCLFILVCFCGCWSRKSAVKLCMAMVFSVILVCALYSDWILGDIADSLVGVPSGDNSELYWAYFAAKRLPLLMT